MWNPEVYLTYADHRGRPYHELLNRVNAHNPRRIVDLGCGPGNLTETLAVRWPAAVIEAWDRAPEMVDAARRRGVAAEVGDVRDWTPAADTDVVVSNATLHWVPEHTELLTRWAALLSAGSWIAFQVPGNFDAPSHRAVRELVRRPEWAEALRDFPFEKDDVVRAPAGYAGLMAEAGCTVDAWETTYVHQLTGEDPVLEWIDGTALRPVRAALTAPQWGRFRSQLARCWPPPTRSAPTVSPSIRSGGSSLWRR